MRKVKLQTGEYYHIFNRGVDKRNVFEDNKDYIRFLKSMKEFNNIKPTGSLYLKSKLNSESNPNPLKGSGRFSDRLVKFITYSLLPNHTHFILKQLIEDGISKFMQKLGMGFTNYFNYKYNRSGYLFQGKFKAIHINKNSYLLYLSCYINGNAEIHKITEAENWQWSSCLDYLGRRAGTLCYKNVILNQFNNIEEYKNLLNIIIKESAQRKDNIKKYLLE